jgi:prevent-host-death family protein
MAIGKNHIGHMIATLRESKTKLSELVQLASGGEEVLITVRGSPRARLLPVAQADLAMGAWMRELASLRAGMKTGRVVDISTVLDEVREDRW